MVSIFIYSKDDPLGPAERLAQAAAHYAPGEGPWQTGRAPGGKPYFIDRPHVHFSISHSGAYWLCAMGAQPLGLDIQQHRSGAFSAIARRFFHPEEIDYLAQGSTFAFFQVWAAKESYVKYTGRGIRGDFGAFSVVENGKIKTRLEGAQLVFVPFSPAYTVCLCGMGLESSALFRPRPSFGQEG